MSSSSSSSSSSTSPSSSSSSSLFPLSTVGDVRKLFQSELETPDPNLSLLSVVAGAIENQWTQAKATNVNNEGQGEQEEEEEGMRHLEKA